MMDVNTKLRDDKFLFPNEVDNKKSNASGIIVTALNKRGIETVNDLFNYDQTQFNRLNAHYLGALIQILKYKYLGEELVNDVILEAKYTRSDKKRLAKDLRRLGFGRDLQELEARTQRFMEEAPTEFTMEDVLKSDNRYISTMRLLGNADFKGFYLEYIEEKKKKEQAEENAPTKDVLEGLKLQLEGLIKMRDGIDRQIQDVQNQINALNNGGQSYGR